MPPSPEPEPLVELDPDDREAVDALIADAARVDGQPPFSDQSLVESRDGRRMTLLATLGGTVTGVAVLTRDGDPREAEFVVRSDARKNGIGARLLDRLLELSDGRLVVWAHGDHPDARALASSRGLVAARELLQLRLDPVVAPAEVPPAEPFRPGVDDEEWLAVNATAFADHPEQGRLTQEDLDARLAKSWFDAEDFLIVRAYDGRMAGFCWLKVQHGVGEFYAVGVHPAEQGAGLGRGLVHAGLARLARRGIRTASLYVEADNVAAVRLYRSVGFIDHTVDVQYRVGSLSPRYRTT